ncbi:MAG TPA: peptidoglycan DD-metalloendopeptidase family protein [Acidimicrobiia bacterium]|nr:peptidoglycan DD-metalloendopeptidase family protein [Acidimicrobiia bacterium]
MKCLRQLVGAARTHRRRASTLTALIALLSSGLLLAPNAATAAPLDTAYSSATSLTITEVLSLDAEGDPEAWFVFKMGPAIIAGHVSWGGAEGVFDDLWDISPGDEIAITRRAGSGAGSAPEMPAVLIRPVPGAVSSGYGYRTHPVYGGQRLHTGWDLRAGCGVPIKSGASGRVVLSGWYGGYGNTIIVDHGGGMATLYAHQSSLGASYNQQVSTGEIIGWVGTTGMSTGCHLHYEVRINGNPVDPTPYM